MRFNNNEKKRTRKSALTKAVATALTVVTIAGTLTSLTAAALVKQQMMLIIQSQLR